MAESLLNKIGDFTQQTTSDTYKISSLDTQLAYNGKDSEGSSTSTTNDYQDDSKQSVVDHHYPEQKVDGISKNVKNILNLIGEDTNREGLLKTPFRSAKAWTELTSGYNQDLDTLLNDAIFSTSNSDIVIVKNIPLFSLCEHHLLPFFGKCHIGYLPDGHILGLSKFSRIVDMYSKRLQVQENLGKQISDTIYSCTKCHGAIVMIEAQHLCMMMRGVNKTEAYTVSVSGSGCFTLKEWRNEFFTLLKNSG